MATMTELRYDDGGRHRKFWRIVKDGSTTWVTYGKIGTEGTTNVKDHGTSLDATRFWNRMVGEKRAKGYAIVAVSDDVASPRIGASPVLAQAPAPPPVAAPRPAVAGKSGRRAIDLDS